MAQNGVHRGEWNIYELEEKVHPAVVRSCPADRWWCWVCLCLYWLSAAGSGFLTWDGLRLCFSLQFCWFCLVHFDTGEPTSARAINKKTKFFFYFTHIFSSIQQPFSTQILSSYIILFLSKVRELLPFLNSTTGDKHDYGHLPCTNTNATSFPPPTRVVAYCNWDCSHRQTWVHLLISFFVHFVVHSIVLWVLYNPAWLHGSVWLCDWPGLSASWWHW